MRALVLILGAICGLVWWVISVVLGAKGYGILGSHAMTGPMAGACTGVVITALSFPIYRFPSPRTLLWFSPLSVYISIPVYGVLVYAIRWGLGDLDPGQLPWVLAAQSILGMWWGVTFLLPIAIPVHLMAYASHRILRSFLGNAGSSAPSPIAV